MHTINIVLSQKRTQHHNIQNAKRTRGNDVTTNGDVTDYYL